MKQRRSLFWAGSMAIVLCLAGIVPQAAAADKAKLDAAVAEISAAYKKIESFRATLVETDVQNDRTISSTVTLHYLKPYYFKADVAVREDNAAAPQKNLTVFDGAVLWRENYGPDGTLLNVMKTKVDPGSAAGADFAKQFVPGTVFTDLLEGYRLNDVQASRGGVKILEMTLNEGTRLEMESEAKARREDISALIPQHVKFYWDSEKGFCRKIETLNVKQKIIATIEYQDVQINAAMDAGGFVYAPPEGAKIMDMTAMMQQRIEAARESAAGMVGRECPDFVLTDLSGKQVARNDFKGKVLIINFWTTWCPACKDELPVLDKVYREFKNDQTIAFFSVSAEGQETTTKFMTDYEITVPALLDTEGAMTKAFGVDAFPRTFIVNKDGKIFQVYQGFQPDMDKELEQTFMRMKNL